MSDCVVAVIAAGGRQMSLARTSSADRLIGAAEVFNFGSRGSAFGAATMPGVHEEQLAASHRGMAEQASESLQQLGSGAADSHAALSSRISVSKSGRQRCKEKS